MFSKNNLKKALGHYFSGLVMIWLAILMYKYVPYYSNFLRNETMNVLVILALAYTLFSFPIQLVASYNGNHETKTRRLFKAFKRIVSDFRHYLKNFVYDTDHKMPKMDAEEKRDFLFLIVKIFFLPILLNFFFDNYFSIINHVNIIRTTPNLFTISNFTHLIYPFGIVLIFLIDTAIFSFGYAFEAKFLKNTIKSVEPTAFGWAVALICYPPFNGLASQYVPWFANDFVYFGSSKVTFVMRLIILFLLWIYVWATIALGAKSSNLTNRGIVVKGPYRFIRHPAYISKNLVWWITILPVMNIAAFLGIFFWSIIYFFRAITEERHLIMDDDYKKYCKKVKYRFVPGIF